MEEIKEFSKKFKPNDESLPFIIPFTFNDLPSALRNGRTVDPNKALKEADRRQEVIRKLRAQLEALQLRQEPDEHKDDEEEIITTNNSKNQEPEPEGMYL